MFFYQLYSDVTDKTIEILKKKVEMPDMYTWGLTLILVGISLAAIGFVTLYYKRRFSGELEICEAVITKFKSTSRRMNIENTVNIFAEYNINGVLTEGCHYIMLPRRSIPFRIGDTVEVKVSPKHPKVFMIEQLSQKNETLILQKNAPVVAAIGTAIFAVGITLAVIGFPY